MKSWSESFARRVETRRTHAKLGIGFIMTDNSEIGLAEWLAKHGLWPK